MSITSLTFLIFIFITLFVYYIVPKRIQWVILLLSSLFFYYVCSNIGIIYVSITCARAKPNGGKSDSSSVLAIGSSVCIDFTE